MCSHASIKTGHFPEEFIIYNSTQERQQREGDGEENSGKEYMFCLATACKNAF